MPEHRNRQWVLPAILAALITLLFIDVLAGYHALYLRDIAQFYHPGKHVVREIVLSGEFPYWNPFVAAGQPLAANPQHEIFYPLTWLILLPGYDFGFQLLLLAHLYIGGWAMYALLRSMNTSAGAAFLGSLSFALGGPLVSSTTLPPILFELAWLPVTCLFTRRFLLERRPRDLALASLAMGLQVLIGEPVSIAIAGSLLAVYSLHVALRQKSFRPLAGLAVILVAALAVGAVALLPAVDHARDSVRAEGFSYDVVTTWSTPAARVGELVFPYFFGHQGTDGVDRYWGGSLYGKQRTPFLPSIYLGILLASMLITGLFLRVRGSGLTLAILGGSLVLAAGSHTPLWQILYDGGLARSVRYPEKFLLMGVFAATVFGARTLDLVLNGEERVRKAALRTAGSIAGVAGAAALIALTPLHEAIFTAVWRVRPALVPEMLTRARWAWMVAALFATLLALLLRNVGTVRRSTWIALATVLILLDLGMLLPEIAPRIGSEFFREPPLLAQRLPGNREAWRFMNVIEWQNDDVAFRPFAGGSDLYWIRRNALRPMTPARWGIRTVMEVDYDLTSLRPTNDFVALGTWLAHGRSDWPQVVAPMANAWFLGSYDDPRRALLRANDERRVVQPVRVDPLGPHPRYFFARRIEPFRDQQDLAGKLATVPSTVGTAYVETASLPEPFAPSGDRVLRPDAGAVLAVRETANTARLEVETAGPAFLVMSVTPHKYWRITVDGREAAAVIVNVGFQGIVVPAAGRHVVEMKYRNPLIPAGGAISVAALLVLGWVAARMRAL